MKEQCIKRPCRFEVASQIKMIQCTSTLCLRTFLSRLHQRQIFDGVKQNGSSKEFLCDANDNNYSCNVVLYHITSINLQITSLRLMSKTRPAHFIIEKNSAE